MQGGLKNLLKSGYLAHGIFFPPHPFNASCSNIALQVSILFHTFCQSRGSWKVPGLVIGLRPGACVGKPYAQVACTAWPWQGLPPSSMDDMS